MSQHAKPTDATAAEPGECLRLVEQLRDRFLAGVSDRHTINAGELREAFDQFPRLTFDEAARLRGRPQARPSATCAGDDQADHRHDSGCLT